jgi:hypothetical protein
MANYDENEVIIMTVMWWVFRIQWGLFEKKEEMITEMAK